MDILPEQLIKAMIAKNLDKMEQLGAYEVAPEDFAFVRVRMHIEDRNSTYRA